MANSPRVYRQPPSAKAGQMNGQEVSESAKRSYRLAQQLQERKLEDPVTLSSGALSISYLDNSDATDQLTLTNTSTSTKRVEINLNGIAKLGTDFTPSNAADVYFRRGGETIWQAGTDNSLRIFPANGALTFGIFGVGPAAQPAAYTQTYATTSRTVPAYTTSAQNVAFTGAADGEAKLADLNSLRQSYETLRTSYDETLKVLSQLLDDLQSYGWLA